MIEIEVLSRSKVLLDLLLHDKIDANQQIINSCKEFEESIKNSLERNILNISPQEWHMKNRFKESFSKAIELLKDNDSFQNNSNEIIENIEEVFKYYFLETIENENILSSNERQRIINEILVPLKTIKSYIEMNKNN